MSGWTTGRSALPSAGRFMWALTPELRLTVQLFALSFLICGVPRVYTQTAAHALFIDAYGAAAMPWAYLAQALCVPLAGLIFIRAQRLVSLRALLIGTLAAQVVALALFRIGIAAGVPLIAGASIVYFEIEFVLSSLLLWGLANQLMTLRQGKRLFGFISAGEPMAVIVCGLSTPLLLRFLSVPDLFLMSAAGTVAGIALVLFILGHHNNPADAAQQDDSARAESIAAPSAWWKDRYVLTLMVMVSVGQMVYFFVDSAFYVEVGKRYPTERELASFLGLYSAVLGGISLACSVLLAPWLLKRFGVRGGLLALPGLLLAGAAATLAAAAWGGTADILFLLIVGIKTIDQSLRYTLDKTTFVTLFQPMPAQQRSRVQAGLESVVEPLSGGIAGLMLFAMLQGLGMGAVGITGAILAVCCVWVGLVAMQYRGYLTTLQSALARRAFGGGTREPLQLDDATTQTVLRRGLTSPRPGEVLYCLTLLDQAGLAPEPDQARALLHHGAREVRLDAARRIERGDWPLAASALAQALAVETDGEVLGALLQASAATDAACLPDLPGYLYVEDTHTRLGAFVGLLRHGGIEGALAAGPALLKALQADDAAQRRFAAQVIGQTGSINFYRPLIALLRDPDPGVAASALRAAGGLQVPQLWPSMLAALQVPGLESAAVNALAAVGAPVLPALDTLRERALDSQGLARALLRVYEHIAGPHAEARILDGLADPRRAMRTRVLQALWRRRTVAPVRQHAHLRLLLQAERDCAAGALRLWRGAQGQTTPAWLLLQRVAQDEVAGCIQNIFALLALRYAGADLHAAWSHYTRGDPSKRAYVVELLDNLLDAGLKHAILPLVEAEGMAQRAERLIPAPTITRNDGKPNAIELHDTASGLLRASVLQLVGAGHVAANASPVDDAVLAQTLTWVAAGRPSLKERTHMLTIEKMMVLRSVALFAAVREEYLASAAAATVEVQLAAGEILFTQGDAGTSLFVIVSGRLDVRVAGRHVAEMGEHDVVGEMALLDAEPRSATVVALQDSLLLRMTSDDLDLLMSEDFEVARGIIQTLCRRLRERNTPSETP